MLTSGMHLMQALYVWDKCTMVAAQADLVHLLCRIQRRICSSRVSQLGAGLGHGYSMTYLGRN
jgi:hypothetical protein